MSPRDILVHVETTRAGADRTELAVRLAQRFEAEVKGVFVLPPLDAPVPPDVNGVVELSVYRARLDEEAEEAGRKFTALLRRENVGGTWHKEAGPAAPVLTRLAAAADLVVLGQYDPEHPSALDAPENVVLACGRPVLVVPYVGDFRHVGERVLVAWNGSREATRAAHDALPLMAASDAVIVQWVNPDGDEERRRVGELSQHLARHGLNASSEFEEMKYMAISDAVLSRVTDVGADLLVMGAYGHSRLREMILGGMTYDVLKQMTVPVLMAH